MEGLCLCFVWYFQWGSCAKRGCGEGGTLRQPQPEERDGGGGNGDVGSLCLGFRACFVGVFASSCCFSASDRSCRVEIS